MSMNDISNNNSKNNSNSNNNNGNNNTSNNKNSNNSMIIIVIEIIYCRERALLVGSSLPAVSHRNKKKRSGPK